MGVVWACFSHLPDPDGKTQIIRCIESLLFLIPWYILNRIECWIPLSILNLYFHLEGVYFFPSCLVLLLCYILRSHCSDFCSGKLTLGWKTRGRLPMSLIAAPDQLEVCRAY